MSVRTKAQLIRVWTVLGVLGLLASGASGATLNVNATGTGDYPTIQAAIDAASAGDEIVCADGTYTGNGNRDIDFSGKAITVRSANGYANCIIDCQGSETDPHRAFKFVSGETETSVLDGLWITHGYAPEENSISQGGAIYCSNSSPTIIRCYMSGSTALDNGGAIYCEGGSPKIIDCDLKYNNANYGGGLYSLQSQPWLAECNISRNEAVSGAGVYNKESSPTIVRCSFYLNTTPASSGGGNRFDYHGAGMYSIDCPTITVTNSAFKYNAASLCGGGIYNCDSDIDVTGCVFARNTAANGSAFHNYAYDTFVAATLTNCTASENNASNGPTIGNGVYCYMVGSDFYALGTATATLTNCILWGNETPEVYGEVMNPLLNPALPLEAVRTWINTSCIQGGWSGEGGNNIDTNPLFVAPASMYYRLYPSSPCRDTGDMTALPSDTTDLDGDGDTTEPLPLDTAGNTRTCGSTVDMGAYEFDASIIPSLVLNSVASRGTHGTEGYVHDIDFSTDPCTCNSEYRQLENWTIVLTFEEDVVIADGTLDTEVTLSTGTIDSISLNGNEIILQATGIPDASQLSVTCEGLSNTYGGAMSPSEPWHLTVLTGDVDGNRHVDIFDMLTCRVRLNSVGAEAAPADVTSDGTVDIYDLLAIRLQLNKTVTCPVGGGE